MKPRMAGCKDMAKITFIEHNGKEHIVDAENGMSVMEMKTDSSSLSARRLRIELRIDQR